MSMAAQRPRVLVTGARRGIGRGIALAFAARGWDVVINDLIQDAAADETLGAVEQAGGRAAFVKADIADLDGHTALLNRAFTAFGGLEALVNNAGISVARRGDMLEASRESFDRLIAVNLRGPFFLTQALARRWLADGPAWHPRSVIIVSSSNSVLASPDRAEYCISKAGLSMMNSLYALRLAADRVGVFELRPGIVRTDMTAVAAERYDRLIADGGLPVPRWGEPADVGEVAATLAEGKFHYSTGEVINVDGGMHIRRL